MIIVILLLVANSYAGDGQFECGPNGRFEYCIDDIPGCVVGCHCYPGYYFDTDSKICEPNTKLTQDFRRHYIIDAGKESTTAEPTPTRTAPAPNSAKDDNDLSDWLYNQFFKTIENQVINKTDDDDLIKKGTRRSGGPMYKRNFKKKRRSKKGSKRSKNHELRRKLLRISEDDSMFDSGSDSRSESEGSSSSSSWESWDPSDAPDAPKHPHDDKEHGHRKIVIFSKKPKPPLPSFIFLPNIETPFYPPIGLPVPALPPPMYPMIPVPPIQPPSQDGNKPSTTKDTAPTVTTSAAAATTTAAPTATVQDASTSQSPETSPVTSPSSPTTTASEEKLNEPDNDKAAEPKADSMARSGRSRLLRGQARNNLLQRLKERNKSQRNMKRKEAAGQRLRKLDMNNFMDQFQDPSNTNGDIFQQPILEDNVKRQEDELVPFDNDVDFKYLTQLIHRVDNNGSTPSSPKMQFNNNRNGLMNLMRPPPVARPGLRREPAPARRRSNTGPTQTDDSYYARLGREIAELIRDIRPDDVDGVHIDVEHEGDRKALPYFGENSFAPRSYWERFVRSPLRLQMGHFSKNGNFKSSNEKLFDLESKVEIAENSSPVLSLPELENVINAMEKAQNQIHSRESKEKNKKPSHSSLNVSLLPRPREKLSNAPKKLSSPVIKTHVGDRSLLNHHDFRRNNFKPGRIKASDIKQANHTGNNKRILTQHNHGKFGYNIQFASTSTPDIIKKNTVPRVPKYQLRPAIIQNDNIHYYFSNIYSKLYPNPTIATDNNNKAYGESKTSSYFFNNNEFEYFI